MGKRLVPLHQLDGCVDVDKYKQQQVEHYADDTQHSKESLLWCAEVRTR